MKSKYSYLSIVFLFLALGLQAQDLGGLKSQKPFKLSGSIGAGTSFYASNEAYKTRDPFAWNLYGSLVPTIYGMSFPLSFVVTQYSKSYSAPFSQFGISPTYKWATLHVGYRSISFSPTVYDGQSFLGVGVELRPQKFQVSAFYGRLNRAVSEDTTLDRRVMPQYSRMGYGLKIGFGKSDKNVSLQFFHAKDKESSIAPIEDKFQMIRPQENSVLGGSWYYSLFSKLTFTGDAALSVLSRDLAFNQLDSIGHWKVPPIVNTLAPINYTTVISFSGNGQLSLMLKNFNVSTRYQRVQPDYKSLGVPYALNDIESINANVGTNLLRGKVNINASFTTQHNNLAKALSSELRASSGNVNINTLISPQLNINFNVNGAQVLQKDGLIQLNDSVRMNQLMLYYSLSPSYTLSGASRQHSINGNLTYTTLNDHNPVTSQQTNGDNFNASANYGLQFLQSYRGINVGMTYSQYGQNEYKYQSIGLNAGANAQFLKEHNLNMQGMVGYFLNRSGGVSTASNITFSLNGGYSWNKYSFSLYSNYIITPPINLNPLDKINRVPYAVNSRNFAGGISFTRQF